MGQEWPVCTGPFEGRYSVSKKWRILAIALAGAAAVIALAVWFFAGPWYYALWHNIMGLPHPWTWYLRECAQSYPVWWIAAPVVVSVAVLAFYWATLARRARRDTGRYDWRNVLRRWVRSHPLLVLFVPWFCMVGWWVLCVHLWGLV